jgi:signal transduction histidine kinase
MSMSLKSKIVLILSFVVGCWALADNLLQRSMVQRGFTALERSEGRADLERAVASIQREVDELESQARGWASWGATRRQIAGDPSEAGEAQLQPRVLAEAGLDLLYLCDAGGAVVWGRIEAPGGDEPIALRDLPAQRISPSSPLLRPRALPNEAGESEERGASGLLVTERGPLLVSAQPVRSPEGGQRQGTLVLGRFLDPALARRLGDRVHVSFETWPLQPELLPARERELFDRITASPIPVLDVVEERDVLHVYTTLPDLRRVPALLLRAEIGRGIVASGREVVRYGQLSTVGTGLLILFVLLQLLQRIVIAPVGRLTRHTVEIGRTDDTSRKLAMDRGDEIGLLSREFDRMMDKLAESRAQNVRTARAAGMSEIATGVLHNVGNVLNSVNVSANLASRRTEQLSVRDLETMVGVLKENGGDLASFFANDPRAAHLLPFLEEVTSTLGDQRGSIAEELASLRTGIEHIAELVRAQQSYAGTKGVFESASLQEQLDAAVKMCAQAYGARDDIEIVREYGEVPRVRVDKHKLMEILVNLVQNARQALLESDTEPKRIVLRTTLAPGGRARAEVCDNGPGIAPENLTRVFQHGFTTKKDGHGFGLHVSANAATEMSSTLRAQSDGIGKGATFVLEVPVQEEAALAA